VWKCGRKKQEYPYLVGSITIYPNMFLSGKVWSFPLIIQKNQGKNKGVDKV